MAAHRSAPASFWCHAHYKCSHCHQEKKKMAMETISPSLSPFEGRFAAQRHMPNRIPEFGAHPHSEDWQWSRQESGWETQRLKERKRERERVLKADLTLGSVTTDQNPLKAIDHFHYSSHVPHLETVYQTQKTLCGQIHTPTHAHEARMPAHTRTHKTIQLFHPSQLHLNIYTGWVSLCKQTFTAKQHSDQFSEIFWCPLCLQVSRRLWQKNVCCYFLQNYLSFAVNHSQRDAREPFKQAASKKSSHNAPTWGFDSSSGGGRGLQIKWQPSECMCLLVFKLCLWAPGLA